MECAVCNAAMDEVEKDTSSGSDMREYVCPRCGQHQIVDRGKALWEVLAEAREEEERS
jgi:predicted RNA-binding Zn-ribbon protein involved in translation (DUF1610 family)